MNKYYVVKVCKRLVVLDYIPDGGKVLADAYTETCAMKLLRGIERRQRNRKDVVEVAALAAIVLFVSFVLL